MKTAAIFILLLSSSLAFSQESQEDEQIVYQFVQEYFKNRQEVVLQQETYKCLSGSTQEDDRRALGQLKLVVSEQEVE